MCQNFDKRTRIDAIAQLLDYAIVEGAELRLPVFVFLVRMARLELGNAAGVSDSRRAGDSPYEDS